MLFALTGIGLSAWLWKISNTCDTKMWVPDKVNPLNFVIKSWKCVGTQSPWIKVNELNLSKLCSRIQNFWQNLGYNWSKNSEKKIAVGKVNKFLSKALRIFPCVTTSCKIAEILSQSWKLDFLLQCANVEQFSQAVWNSSNFNYG